MPQLPVSGDTPTIDRVSYSTMVPKVGHGKYLPWAVPVETDWDYAKPRSEICAVRRIEQAPFSGLPRPVKHDEHAAPNKLERQE